MFAPTSSRPLSGMGTGAHDYVPQQDDLDEKDVTAAGVDGAASRSPGTHTATTESRHGSSQRSMRQSSLTEEEQRQVRENAEVGSKKGEDEDDTDAHPHLLHGSKLHAERKSLNQPGARGERELEGHESHHTCESSELKGNGVHGHPVSEGPGEKAGGSGASVPGVAERVKGRAEVIVGKLTHDRGKVDEGLARQRQVEMPSSNEAVAA